MEGNWKLMVGFELVYVVLLCMKQYVQVYIDNCQGWMDVINNVVQKGMVYDVFELKLDWEVMNVEWLFSMVWELWDVVVGCVVFCQVGLVGGDSLVWFIVLGCKYLQLYVVLLVFDCNGKLVGIWLNLLIMDDGNGLWGFSGEGWVKGSGDVQFVVLQGSCNGESLLVDNMQDGVWIVCDNFDSGVVVRIVGEGCLWNFGVIIGGCVWGDILDNSVQLGVGNGELVMVEVLVQWQVEEVICCEMECCVDEIVCKMVENKFDLLDGKIEQVVREIVGQECDWVVIIEWEVVLLEGVLCEF